MATIQTSGLQNVVQDVIQQGRVGQPQFLRCIANVSDASQLDQTVVHLEVLANSFFGSEATSEYKLGEGSNVYLTQMLKWSQGQGALITVSVTPDSDSPSLDLMMVGSRGTLYHSGSEL